MRFLKEIKKSIFLRFPHKKVDFSGGIPRWGGDGGIEHPTAEDMRDTPSRLGMTRARAKITGARVVPLTRHGAVFILDELVNAVATSLGLAADQPTW